MVKYLCLLAGLLLGAPLSTLAQKSPIPPVSFVEQQPLIDGILDAHLRDLPVHEFPHFLRLGNPKTEPVQVTYRMAYTPTHLYLYLETDADSLSYHELGNLWGDGYKVLIGKAQKGGKTNEYYDLACSPSQDPSYWARQRVVAYNFSQPYFPLSEATQSQEKAFTGKTGFEVMIAWEDIYPYHPWFVPDMGYNIYFAKGINLPGHGYFPNGYAVVKDNGIWDEEIPKRRYAPIRFQAPVELDQAYLMMRPHKRTYHQGESIQVDVVGMAETASTESFTLEMADSTGNPILSQPVQIQMGNGGEVQALPLNTAEVRPGIYTLTLRGKEPLVREIAILPVIPYADIQQTLTGNRDGLSGGTVATLAFYLQELKEGISQLKPYESGAEWLEKWETFEQAYRQFLAGLDPYEDILTPYRRAFPSKYDDTYQPFSINLPDDYDPAKQYPLLVFLHGSGRDEQGLLDLPRSNGKFIELAPYGRDKFRAYAEKYSQRDILEAIEHVKTHFSVDPDKIVIGGFSMGGYGALRTFYENPDLYKGVAVFAGHPNLANEWLTRRHPNFGKQGYLEDFAGVPVFLYHGEKDAALPIQAARDLAQALRTAGAEVSTRFIPDKAHEYPDEETHELYVEWLEAVISER